MLLMGSGINEPMRTSPVLNNSFREMDQSGMGTLRGGERSISGG